MRRCLLGHPARVGRRWRADRKHGTERMEGDDDAATAALMAQFYKEMFTNKKPPAAALRAAQLNLMQRRNWQSPYYWAGFVLQGEWR